MKRKCFAAWLAALLLLVGGGCGWIGTPKSADAPPSSEAEEPALELDPGFPVEAGGIRLQSRPQTVISLAPALTEKLIDLGLEERLSGISDFCDPPPQAQELPTFGTAQLPETEAIAELAPQLLLSEAPLAEPAAAALEELGIPVAVFPHAADVDTLMENYHGLACLLEGETDGGEIAGLVEKAFRDRLQEMQKICTDYTEENEKKQVLYLRLLDFTVATGDTFEGQLLETLSMENIARAHTGWMYPEEEATSADGQAVFAAVDVLFMDEAAVTIKDLEQNTFYKGLPATIQDRYLYISSLRLERQSLRTLDELARMAAYVYPDAPFDSVPDEDETDTAQEDRQDGMDTLDTDSPTDAATEPEEP